MALDRDGCERGLLGGVGLDVDVPSLRGTRAWSLRAAGPGTRGAAPGGARRGDDLAVGGPRLFAGLAQRFAACRTGVNRGARLTAPGWREVFLLSRGADTMAVMHMRTIPLSGREPRLSALADRANERLERIIFTREGEARAVLLAAQDYDGLLETLEILSDGELVQRLVAAKAEVGCRGGRSLDEVREGMRRGRGSTRRSG